MKKKGFTLIETLVALAIFMLTITFFYQYSANTGNQKIKSVRNSNLDKLSVGVLNVVKNQTYDDLIKNKDVKDLSSLKSLYPEVGEVIENTTTKGVDKNKILVKLEIKTIEVEYGSGYEPPQYLEADPSQQTIDKYSKLVYNHWKINNSTEINPFESDADEILKGILTISYTQNKKTLKITREFYVFK